MYIYFKQFELFYVDLYLVPSLQDTQNSYTLNNFFKNLTN
jgi:hypothetical protein